MKSTLCALLLAVLVYWAYSTGRAWRKNIEAAKRSGLPYVISPIYLYSTFWMVSHKLWLPFLRKLLPTSWTENWIDFVTPDWVWEKGFAPFTRNGDTFCTVAPGGVLVWTVDAEAITQICAKREAFPKPLESYEILNIFGKSLLSTEGQTWKAHRKITSPSFNEKNNVLVFEESVKQGQQMLQHWTGLQGNGNTTLETLATDTMRTTLHIISRVGFGVSLLWPGEKPKTKDEAAGSFSSAELLNGHTMSFAHALATLLERLLLVVLIPRWLLKRLPMESTKEAYESFVEWGKYMNEIFKQKVEEAKAGKSTDGMDIMGNLVKSSYAKKDNSKTNKVSLTDDEILGNAFVIVIAGHETTANALHFALIQLALNPHSQRLLQSEVDSIFDGKAPDTWDYDQCLNKLTGSMIGAVMNELLRVIPSIIVIPKQVTKHSSQPITIAGKKHDLPAGAMINLNAVGTMRNPKYWPSLGPSKISDKSNDLEDFVPERWLLKTDEEHHDTRSGSPSSPEQTDSEDDTKQGPCGPDTSSHLFRPTRGSYIPFSEGARSCPGRRFAQVEVLAILAVIFQKYSIELAVDEWASDVAVEGMERGGRERKEVYEMARVRAREKIREASSLLTLRLQKGSIPVRVVRRGEERFIGDFE